MEATSSGKSNEILATTGSSFVDVRDLANAHVLALRKEAAGGERILVVNSRPLIMRMYLHILTLYLL